MSYDVDAGYGGHNYTYNMHRFFKDFDAYPPSWDGRPRSDVADSIDAALVSIHSNPLDDLRTEYDADNGWGDVPTAIAFLEAVRDSCRSELPTIVRVT